MTMIQQRVLNAQLLEKLQQIENELLEHRRMINVLGNMVQRIGDKVDEILLRTTPSPEDYIYG